VVDADQGEVAEIDATTEVEVAPKYDRFRGGSGAKTAIGALTAARQRSRMWLLTK
jgi:hypothetical protein